MAPVIRGGDFNDVCGTLDARFMHPSGFGSGSVAYRSFPAVSSVRVLGDVFFRDSIAAVSDVASRARISREVSGHLPSTAEFKP